LRVLPPLIGYAAAGHSVDIRALALFLILFAWQFPHFEAIAWIYRDDYARGGIRMLPVIDPDGKCTAKRIIVSSLLLIAISLAPAFLGMTGALYAAAAIPAGVGLLYFGVRLARERTSPRARALLPATVFYLPALFCVMMLDRRVL
jgi:heme o synthase